MYIHSDNKRYAFYGQGEETFLRYTASEKEYTVRVSTIDVDIHEQVIYFLLHDDMPMEKGVIPKGSSFYLEYDAITHEDQ